MLPRCRCALRLVLALHVGCVCIYIYIYMCVCVCVSVCLFVCFFSFLCLCLPFLPVCSARFFGLVLWIVTFSLRSYRYRLKCFRIKYVTVSQCKVLSQKCRHTDKNTNPPIPVGDILLSEKLWTLCHIEGFGVFLTIASRNPYLCCLLQ